MVVLTPIERETLSQVFFLHISQMLNVSTFGNTADIYAMVHLVPHACQHITVDQSHSSGGHCIIASLSFPVCPIHLCGKFRLRYPRTSM